MFKAIDNLMALSKKFEKQAAEITKDPDVSQSNKKIEWNIVGIYQNNEHALKQAYRSLGDLKLFMDAYNRSPYKEDGFNEYIVEIHNMYKHTLNETITRLHDQKGLLLQMYQFLGKDPVNLTD